MSAHGNSAPNCIGPPHVCLPPVGALRRSACLGSLWRAAERSSVSGGEEECLEKEDPLCFVIHYVKSASTDPSQWKRKEFVFLCQSEEECTRYIRVWQSGLGWLHPSGARLSRCHAAQVDSRNQGHCF